MNGRPADFAGTTRLISGLLDGRLPPDECLRLDSRLQREAEARRLYLQMIDQEIELSCLLAPARDRMADVMVRGIEDESAGRAGWRRRAVWLLGVAAMIVVALALWPRVTPKEPIRAVWPIAESEPLEWNADFESGSARGWIGEIVREDLPAGSKFAIRSVERESAGELYAQLHLPADWDRGLFALTARSTVHLTYRHRTPTGWLNVFMHTDGGNFREARNSMFILQHGRFPGAVGEWQTASIPFSRFIRKEIDPLTGELAFIGGAPRDGELVFALFFSGSPGFDLVIDRIWITPDGPGIETIHALQ